MTKVLPIDDFIEIHKKMGLIILVEGLIHTGAHFINLWHDCLEMGYNYLDVLFTGSSHSGANVMPRNIGYPTGIILLVMLMVIFVCAMPFVRRGGHFQVGMLFFVVLYFFFHSNIFFRTHIF